MATGVVKVMHRFNNIKLGNKSELQKVLNLPPGKISNVPQNNVNCACFLKLLNIEIMIYVIQNRLLIPISC
jgi:hypothetical protein